MAEGGTGPHETFEKAAEFAKSRIGSMSTQVILHLYGLYKQATVGPNTTPKPNFWNVSAKQKWEAWAAQGTKSKETAMEEYIGVVTQIDSSWAEQPVTNIGWAHHSTLVNQEDSVPDADKDLFYWVKENDIDALKSALADGADVTTVDQEGLSLVHWAADRGHLGVLRTLLEAGAEPDVLDEDGQTALHYAASCGHPEAVKILLQGGAAPNLSDSEGNKPKDVAATPEIEQILTNFG